MHIVIRDYKDEAPEVIAEVKKLEASVKAAIGAVPGLVGWYLIETGRGSLATITICDNEAGAQESVRIAANWVRENLAQWAPNAPTVTSGGVVVSVSR